MGYFTEAEQRASPENPSTNLANPDEWLVDWARGKKTNAGLRVGHDTALEISAVWRAVNAIASQVATLPFPVYRRLDPRGKERVPGHHVHKILHDRPNPEMTPATFVDALQGHLLTWGNAFAEIERDNMDRPRWLWPITPDRVKVERRDGQKIYRIRVDDRYIWLGQDRIFHIPGPGFDGLLGHSPISLARQSLGLTKAAEEFGAYYFGNGSRASGVLQHPGRLSDDASTRLRESWAQMHQGLGNAHRAAILEEGMTWEQIGIPPEDAQFLQTRKFQTVEVARWFGIPPHKLYELDRATFSNIEQQSIEFDRDTLRPWLVRWEQTANWDLFGPIERGRYFARFVMEGVLRADTATRSDFYQAGINNGWFSPNDVLELEDKNPIPEGDRYFVRRDLVPLDALDDLIQMQTAPPPAPPPPEPDGDDGEGDADEGDEEDGGEEGERTEQRTAAENRAVSNRLSLRERHKPLFAEAAASTVTKEAAAVRAALKKAFGGRDEARLRELIDEFYETHDEWVAERFMTTLRTYAANVAAEAAGEVGGDTPADLDGWVAVYASKMGRRWVGSSAGQLRQIIGETEAELIEATIEERLDSWQEKRPGKTAGREVVELGEAVVGLTFAAAGVTELRWLAAGDNCPLCDELNGRTVGIQGVFVSKGDTVDPADGSTTPLTSEIDISHPPLHQGCDCAIVPG